MRRAVTVLAGIAAVLLGLTHIGVTPLTPGPDFGFEWDNKILNSQRVLVLSVDHGDLVCWVNLRLRHHPKEISAKLSDGTPLKIWPQTHNNGQFWIVEISKQGEQRRLKFAWPSGLDLIVSNEKESMQGVVIEDWQIYSEKEGQDSKEKALRRNIWSGISVILLGITLFGVFLKGAQNETDDVKVVERPRFTPELCVMLVIDGIEVPDEEKFQAILSKYVLEGVDPKDALVTIRDYQVWFKARKQYLDRMTYLIKELQEAKEKIARWRNH